jgi:hypothetical protein
MKEEIMKKFLIALFAVTTASQFASADSLKIDASKFMLGTLIRLTCISQNAKLDIESLFSKCSNLRNSKWPMVAEAVTEAQLNGPPGENTKFNGELNINDFSASTKTLVECLLVTGKMGSGFTHVGAMNLCEVRQTDRAGSSSRLLLQHPLTE